MVLTATMLIFILVAMALTISTVSRRLTARYAYFMGLYDLAVSGNEKALFLLDQEWERHRDAVTLQALTRIIQDSFENLEYSNGEIHLTATALFQQIFIQEAMTRLNYATSGMFPTRELRCFHASAQFNWSIFSWDMEVEIETEDITTIDVYRVITTFRSNHSNDRFIVRTDTRKYVNDVPGFPTQVEASIVWELSGYRKISLDEHTINILGLNNVFYPINIMPGTIIFLDEFTLTMVESMRNDISLRNRVRSDDPWVN